MKSLRTLLRSRLEWVEDQLMKNAEKNGYGYITPSMARLYSYLGDNPVPMSELARRLKISRQAVHQLVAEGLNSNFLEVVDSSEDKRIKLVKFSEKGRQMSDVALAEIHQAEKDLAKYLGEDNVKALRRILEMDWPDDLTSNQ